MVNWSHGRGVGFLFRRSSARRGVSSSRVVAVMTNEWHRNEREKVQEATHPAESRRTGETKERKGVHLQFELKFYFILTRIDGPSSPLPARMT